MLLESTSPHHIHIYCIYGVKHIGYSFFILFATTKTDLAKVCISLTVSEIHMGLMQCCLWRVQHHPQTPHSSCCSGISCPGIPAMSHCAAVSYLCIAWPRWDHQYFILCRIPACHCCLSKHYGYVRREVVNSKIGGTAKRAAAKPQAAAARARPSADSAPQYVPSHQVIC